MLNVHDLARCSVNVMQELISREREWEREREREVGHFLSKKVFAWWLHFSAKNFFVLFVLFWNALLLFDHNQSKNACEEETNLFLLFSQNGLITGNQIYKLNWWKQSKRAINLCCFFKVNCPLFVAFSAFLLLFCSWPFIFSILMCK